MRILSPWFVAVVIAAFSGQRPAGAEQDLSPKAPVKIDPAWTGGRSLPVERGDLKPACSIGERARIEDSSWIAAEPLAASQYQSWSYPLDAQDVEKINFNCMVYFARIVAPQSDEFIPISITEQRIDNAFAAMTKKGQRIMVVDPFWLRDLSDVIMDRMYVSHRDDCPGLEPDGSDPLSIMGATNRVSKTDLESFHRLITLAVLGHEIGHHTFRHTEHASKSLQEQVLREEGADALAAYWLGYDLAKSPYAGMLADPRIVQAVAVDLFNHIGGMYDSDHPDSMKRMTLIRDYFDKGLQDATTLGRQDPPSEEDVKAHLGPGAGEPDQKGRVQVEVHEKKDE